jgi:O-antigen ligase
MAPPDPETSGQLPTRYLVPVAAAVLLTFGRTGMLPFLGRLTLLDQALNIFVVVIAPMLCLVDFLRNRGPLQIARLVPLILLAAWVAIVIIVLSPPERWPSRTTLITIGLSIFLCSQIRLAEIHHIRRTVLVITAIFCVCVLWYGRDTLRMVMGGAFIESRLGADVSASAIVAFPRIMYVLLGTCIVTMVIEEKKWIRIAAAFLIPIPLIIGIASGARGPLFSLMVALTAFVLGLKRKVEVLLAAVVLGLFGVIGYSLFLSYFPMQGSRLLRDNRSAVWAWALTTDISIWGHGITSRYPHNIFLEFLMNYGMIGLTLFLIALSTSVLAIYGAFRRTGRREILWAFSILVLQLTAQQFSLSIYYAGALWAAMALPLGFSGGPVHTGVSLSVPSDKAMNGIGS